MAYETDKSATTDKIQYITGRIRTAIEKVTHDSREVERDTLFVCIKGSATDGALYVGEAVEKGAVADFSGQKNRST